MSLLTTEELAWLSSLHLGEITKVQQFSNALTNHVFLLTIENELQIVFKRLNSKARDLDMREKELAVQHMASARGLSAKVIADCQHYRVVQYIAGDVLSDSALTGETIEQLALQLRLIHQLPAKYAAPQALADELLKLNNQLNQDIDQSEFCYYWRLATQLDANSAKDTLCHGDLSFNNIIQMSDGQIKILDWEYAVLACPAYDLAACCCINGFNPEQQAQLIEHYYLLHKNHLSLSLAQLQENTALYYSVFTYLNELWKACFYI